jgi:hypothetical protein
MSHAAPGAAENETLRKTGASGRRAPVVHINPTQLAMLLFMQIESTIGITLRSAGAILHGRRGDVRRMVKENFP